MANSGENVGSGNGWPIMQRQRESAASKIESVCLMAAMAAWRKAHNGGSGSG